MDREWELKFSNLLAQRISQDLSRQFWDPGHPEHGGLVHGHTQRPDPGFGATGQLTACLLLAYAASEQWGTPLPQSCKPIPLHEHLEAALGFLRQAQRPSGCIDLLVCNFDSASDTAFVVTTLGRIYLLLERQGWPAALHRSRSSLRTLLKKTIPGLCQGGVHTPNHRWVLCGGLAVLQQIFPEKDLKPFVDQWLMEGIDINEEGFFDERSIAVYDGYCIRGLLAVADVYAEEGAYQAVRASLSTNLHFLDASGRADTRLSTRQDHGKDLYPINLIDSYVALSVLEGDLQFQQAACLLLQAAMEVPGATIPRAENKGPPPIVKTP